MFVTIISQNWPFTLSRLVPLLPRDVIMLGHLTSAYSLPHALQNISLCSVYLKKLLSQVDEYVELESLPASTKNLLDDACDNVRSLVPVFTNYFQQATKRTAKELYMAVLARDVNQLLKSFSWNVDQTSYNKARVGHAYRRKLPICMIDFLLRGMLTCSVLDGTYVRFRRKQTRGLLALKVQQIDFAS